MLAQIYTLSISPALVHGLCLLTLLQQVTVPQQHPRQGEMITINKADYSQMRAAIGDVSPCPDVMCRLERDGE